MVATIDSVSTCILSTGSNKLRLFRLKRSYETPANNIYSCAGICELSKDPSTGKLTRIRLKLSTPLLQYRPRSDTIDTLLHEAIHAYFFITTSWRHARGDDGTGHGVGFQMLADAINNHGNYQVTIYHTFHDEVDSYRTHVWQCDGPCKARQPYFGFVKRSMNRAPSKSDTWWAKHEVECGGSYTKIREPTMTKKQLDAMSAKDRAGRQKNKLDSWVKPSAKSATTTEGRTASHAIDLRGEYETSRPATSKRKATTLVLGDAVVEDGAKAGQKRPRVESDGGNLSVDQKAMVVCPICDQKVAETDINRHLDVVHLA